MIAARFGSDVGAIEAVACSHIPCVVFSLLSDALVYAAVDGGPYASYVLLKTAAVVLDGF